MPTNTEALKQKLLTRKKTTPILANDFLSSGSTLLNLAATGRISGCFCKGRYFWLVGDSTSGKTFLALTCLAEASINPNFKDYRFIFDDAEDGALMNKTQFFGPGVTERVEPPKKDKNGPVFSTTIEEFYYHLDDAFKVGKPFIYVLDSMDAISDKDEIDKFQERKKAAGTNKDVSGSYGTTKAKLNKQMLRQMRPKLQKSGSILIIISQTIANIGFGAAFQPKTAAGGGILKFFATLELWSSVRQHIQKSIRGKNRELGIIAKVQVKKNRITGRDRSVEIPIYHSHGIDDIGSMCRFLTEEKHWDVVNGLVEADELKQKLKEEALIAWIENNNEEVALQGIVARAWDDLELACSVKRKSKYHDEE